MNEWVRETGGGGAGWWLVRWQELLTTACNAGRRRRGRRLVAAGQVRDLRLAQGMLTAQVVDRDGQLQLVRMGWPAASDTEWTAVIDQLAARALFVAQLLAGELPQEMEEIFAAAGTALFPSSLNALQPACGCPDPAPICKHIAAVHLQLANQLQEDPFLLFRLHGREPERVLAALRARRQGEEMSPDRDAPPAAAATAPLEAEIDRFWQSGPGLETLAFTIEAPATPLPVLHRLGQPPFLDVDLQEALGPVVTAVSHEALRRAFTPPP